MPKHQAVELKPFDAAEYLADERTVAEYLNAAAEMGDPAVLLDAFAAVGRAKGMAELASKSQRSEQRATAKP
jgi:probable addiction module antidote protein